MADPRLKVVIEAVDHASKTIDNIGKQNLVALRRLSLQLTAVGAVVTGFSTLAVNAAVSQRAAIGQLDRALQQMGSSYEEHRAQLEPVLDQISRLSGLSRGELAGALTTLIDNFHNVDLAIRVLPVAVDMAKGAPMELGAAISLITAALSGDDGAIQKLRELGVVVTDAHDPFQLLTDINKRFKGSAEEALTPLKQIRAALGRLAETIGTAVAPVLVPLIEKLSDLVRNVDDFLERHPKLAAALGTLAAAFGIAAFFLGILGTIFSTVMLLGPGIVAAFIAIGVAVDIALGPIGLIVLAILGLIAVGVLLWLNWEKVWNFIKDFTQGWTAWFVVVIGGVIAGPIGALVAAGFMLWRNWDTIWGGIQTIVKTAANAILGTVEAVANGVVGAVNAMVRALNALSFSIPGWVPGLGGKSFGLNLPTVPEVTLPRLAEGGRVLASGLAMVGERGPEVLALPRGASVAPLGKVGAGATIVINFNAPVYSLMDFEQQVLVAVRSAVTRGGLDAIVGN